MHFESLVATSSLGWCLVACGSGKSSQMALPNEEFDLILQMITLVGVVNIVIMEATELSRIPPRKIVFDCRRPPVWSSVLCGM